MSNVKSSYEWQNFVFQDFISGGIQNYHLLKQAIKCLFLTVFLSSQGQIQSWTLGGGLNCLLHVKSFLPLLFPIWNIAVWGGHNLQPPFGSAPVAIIFEALKHCLRNNREQFLCCFPCNKLQFPPDPFIMPTVLPTI